LLDGRPLKDYNVAKLRQQIGYVMQEPTLFNETIAENIKYGFNEATDQQIWQAAKLSHSL